MLIPRRVLTAILLTSSSRRALSFTLSKTIASSLHLISSQSSPSLHIRSNLLSLPFKGQKSITRAFAESSNMSESTASTEEAATATRQLQERIVANLESVRSRVIAACQQANQSPDNVRLVAVSKTQPLPALAAAYDQGTQRVFFGENYVQELVDKVHHFKDHADIIWHFIGALQSNKVNTLVNAFDIIQQLVVETVSSEKLANKLNTAVASKTNSDTDTDESKRLKIFIQVNTSGEDSKSGIKADPASVVGLCRLVTQNCPHLQLQGLMTIGAPGDSSAFDVLRECRDAVERELGLESGSLELSMGMSNDFETAIAKGSTNVRVGSTIFGARDYSNKK